MKRSMFALLAAAVLATPLAWAANEPENVSGVSAVAKSSSSILVSWNTAKDSKGGLVDHYRVYYGDKSVQNGAALYYESEMETPNNTPSFELSGLKPATTYYFSVTAIDSADAESPEYSIETNAATKAAEGQPAAQPAQNQQPAPANNADTIPPIVMSVAALDSAHVTLKFSEKVQLPQLAPEGAFTIHEQINPANSLQVKSAGAYPEDPSGKIVILETGPQTKNINYVVTASAAITDMAGNPIVSGTTDSGFFAGSDKAPAGQASAQPSQENQAIPVECGAYNAQQPNTKGAKDCFELSFGTCAPANYAVLSQGASSQEKYEYRILGMKDGLCQIESKYTQHSNASWVGQAMTCQYDSKKPFADAERELLESLGGSAEKGSCSGELYQLRKLGNFAQQGGGQKADITPPEEISDLVLSFKEKLDKFIVVMNWTPSLNTAKDLMDQILYQSDDLGKTYGAGKSLGKEAKNYETEALEGGKEYTFKITTKDASGNESVGEISAIRLPAAGLGSGALVLGSAALAHYGLRRRKRN